MQRTKEEAANTRERLPEVALVSFHRKGYAATTLDDIARQAQITQGAIQWHCSSKADIYNTLLRERSQEVEATFQEISQAQGTSLQTRRRILVTWLVSIEEKVILRTLPELVAGMSEKVQSKRAMMRLFADLIRHGIASGEIRPDILPEEGTVVAAPASRKAMMGLSRPRSAERSLVAHPVGRGR